MFEKSSLIFSKKKFLLSVHT